MVIQKTIHFYYSKTTVNFLKGFVFVYTFLSFYNFRPTALMVWCFVRFNKKKSEKKDSRIHSKVLIWIKWFVNPLRSPDLNQMIHEPTPKSWSESNDSWTHSEVLIWIKWFMNPANNDLRTIISDQDSESGPWIIQFVKWFANLLRSSDLYKMIHEPAPKFRSI